MVLRRLNSSWLERFELLKKSSPNITFGGMIRLSTNFGGVVLIGFGVIIKSSDTFEQISGS